jgi:YgiT-type zinc finger domain-containing protein
MTGPEREERLVEQLVTYTVEIDGRVIIVENVPARVDEETGARYFSPSTVERLQEIMWSEQAPDRVVETPVFEFAA